MLIYARIFFFTSMLISSCHLLGSGYERLTQSQNWHCLEDHVSEAIALNEERKVLYSRLTHGASEDISNALVKSEESLLRTVPLMASLLARYRQAGIPLLCREYVPMARVGSFAETYVVPPPHGPVNFVNPYGLVARLSVAYANGGLDQLASSGRDEIRHLDKPLHYQCMIQHFLESMVKSAEVAKVVDALALEAGLHSTLWITDLAIKAQLVYLIEAARIDRLAEDIHRLGIPILCNDLPVILEEFAPEPSWIIGQKTLQNQ